jgi:hypothetical protein
VTLASNVVGVVKLCLQQVAIAQVDLTAFVISIAGLSRSGGEHSDSRHVGRL